MNIAIFSCQMDIHNPSSASLLTFPYITCISTLKAGIVTSDSSVLTKIHPDAYTASPSYFSAKIAVVLPAGIPASKTETPVTSSGVPSILQIKSVTSGMASSRNPL